ncbi:NAD(P)H oxidoreductase [Plantibacter sp. Mn2098]|uniref:NAD(P)H oxidoreductase n=1 Tax=Plantibacter sp. Mn2098 TaxID=3395266 RepID=UPI003BC3BE13
MTKRATVIWAHPRTDSLTATITSDVIEELTAQGFEVDEIDLHREGFDPLVREADEPDFITVDKQYTPEVMELAARTKAADALVFVFPVWWYSVPAIMKGYIDRVWNFGLFYGEGRRSGIAAARWIGLAGESAEAFRKREYDDMIARNLNVGIAGLCGVGDSRVVLLHDTLGDGIDDLDAHYAALRAQARSVAEELAGTLAVAEVGA